MLKFILFVLISFQASAFAAICSCDAPPSCGRRPASCHNSISRLLVGKTFSSQNGANSVKMNFSEVIKPRVLSVNITPPSPEVGTYTAIISSPESFNLMFKPHDKQTPEWVDQFQFSAGADGQVQYLKSSDGTEFFLD